MYVDYVRNRSLLIIMSAVVLLSLSFNLRQFLDVDYYKKLLHETQETMKNLVPNVVPVKVTTDNGRSLPVNKEDHRCLSESIYFEAATQSLVGKIAVGNVILNRMRNPRFPNTVCGVVNQKVNDVCQFSWKCEPEKPIRDQRAWRQSQQVAYDLLSRDRKDIVDITEGATHFHASWTRPGWKLKLTTKIDDHLFYR